MSLEKDIQHVSEDFFTSKRTSSSRQAADISLIAIALIDLARTYKRVTDMQYPPTECQHGIPRINMCNKC